MSDGKEDLMGDWKKQYRTSDKNEESKAYR